MYRLTELIKKEYDIALEMELSNSNYKYWFGRSTAFGELLDFAQKFRNKPYKSCKLCESSRSGCRNCFLN